MILKDFLSKSEENELGASRGRFLSISDSNLKKMSLEPPGVDSKGFPIRIFKKPPSGELFSRRSKL